VAIYLKNADLLAEVRKSKEKGELTPEAVRMFILLANKCSERLKYKNPDDREDCISSAIEDLLRYWARFDETKSTNAFAYFTQISKNGFAKGWKKLYNVDMGVPISISNDSIYNI
jgi:DNA-directed RNA polymerase specialized sigma subunit